MHAQVDHHWIEHASAIVEAHEDTLVLLEFLPGCGRPGRTVPAYALEDGLV